MEISRRQWIQMGQACLAAAAIPAMRAEDGSFTAGERRLAALSHESFAGHLDSSFAVRREGSTAWIRLAKVEDTTVAAATVAGRRAPRTESFVLHFLGPGADLAEGTYTVEHAALGSFPMFLAPAGGAVYTAVFNRLVGFRSRA